MTSWRGSAARTVARSCASGWARRTCSGRWPTRCVGSADRPEYRLSVHDAGREGHRVARHATADAQVEDARGVALVLDEGMGPGMVDGDRAPVDGDLAGAREDRPHAARLVGAGVGARLLGGRRGDERAGIVLGTHGLDRIALDVQQLLDRALGLRVGPLAEVDVDE